VSDDAELIEYVRTRVGAEHGLTEAQSRRLVGTTLKALHDDASSMAKELDVDDPSAQARDDGGRYARREHDGASMNAIIRQAAGR
jgi:hypothetical protein